MLSARARAALEYVGANVRRERHRAGLTQEALAEAADIDLRFLQRVERAGTNVSVAILADIAGALGVDPGRLFKKAELPPAQLGRPRRKRASRK